MLIEAASEDKRRLGEALSGSRDQKRSGRRVAYVGDSASPAAREGATGRTHKTRCSAFFAISS